MTTTLLRLTYQGADLMVNVGAIESVEQWGPDDDRCVVHMRSGASYEVEQGYEAAMMLLRSVPDVETVE